ncbi:AI-2E family transporter [Okibacterium fritillariae]|uniref:Predicted PurR-regulated permease PerM n=1 Tax=Okibacterium fritillariae TaxID=123320 RepID=A0A1T5IZR6_9MICO|nr:AI-2E family transporter [Okibacterium fritillariae]SKC44696.1 Predicted PurR-regulated permease PerM [Okibacterium fritillariae]
MSDTTKSSWWQRLFQTPSDEHVVVVEDSGVDEDAVPRGMRIAGAWGWRILVIAGVTALAVFLVIQLRLIVIPLLIGVLVAALLTPLVNFLHRHKWPRGLAIAAAMLGALVAVSGLLALAIWQISRQFGEVRDRTVQSFDDLKEMLLQSPLHITEADINAWIQGLFGSIQQDSQVLVSGALSIGSTLGHVATGLFLSLFCLLFILIDGRGIWRWVVRLMPRRARSAVDGAGKAGWFTLTNYARTQILVATIDAAGIGIGAFALGVPLAAPIAVLVFLGAFVPIVGAVVTGAVAVFIALVYNGWVIALIMLGIVLLVQQVEGHVLQPLLMGSAVKVHPLAVVLVVAGGTLLAGIPGALFAVPIAAVINVMVRYVASGVWKTPGLSPQVVPGSALWQTVPRNPHVGSSARKKGAQAPE